MALVKESCSVVVQMMFVAEGVDDWDGKVHFAIPLSC